mmetsp:Transcript_13436/g.19373  ORF Transcript_13436/g.19373 Transcript_13436/m.19373 type:complete len:107 (+) Transcript_13436:1173-1493(+)
MFRASFVYVDDTRRRRGGQTGTKLAENGGKDLSKKDMAKWLSDVDKEGLRVVGLCAQDQREGETLIKLAEFGETYLLEGWEEMAKWLSHLSSSLRPMGSRPRFFAE